MEAVSLADVQLKLDSNGLIPAVVQQEGTGEVLMVAWMNEESLRLTFQTGTTWFWSRSRKELWNKGATSGNMQQVKRVLVDCDADTLVVEVDSPGPACHTGHRSCFYRELREEVPQGDASNAIKLKRGSETEGILPTVPQCS